MTQNRVLCPACEINKVVNTEESSDQEQKGKTLVTHYLRFQYLSLLVFLIVLACLEYAVFKSGINFESATAEAINISGRQRMLSERSKKKAYLMVYTKDQKMRQDLRSELAVDINFMKSNHKGLIYGNKEINLPPLSSRSVKSLYFSAPVNLSGMLTDYWNHIDELVHIPDETLTTENPRVAFIFNAISNDQLLTAQEQVVTQYELENRQQMNYLENVETGSLIATILTLGFTGIFLFHPMVSRIQSQFEEITLKNTQLEKEISQRQILEEQLVSERNILRNYLDSMTDGVLITDMQGKILDANQTCLDLLGFEKIFLANKTIDALLPEAEKPKVASYNKSLLEQNVVEDFETRVLPCGSEEEVTILLSSTIVRDPLQNPLFFISVIRDLTKDKKIAEALRQALHEKEFLLQELHHRVKNNLQMLSSLFSIQAGYITQDNGVKILEESQMRIQVMSLIQENLRPNSSGEGYSTGKFIEKLAHHVHIVYRNASNNILLELNIEETLLSLRQATSCGLLVQELLSNAFKHAFPNSDDGCIQLSLKDLDSNKIQLTVKDNGTGLPGLINMDNPETMGLRLTSIMIQQLKASLEIDINQGTTFRISFEKVEVNDGTNQTFDS